MDDFVELPNMPGYVSIKEAAKMLNLSTRRVYDFVVSGRLHGVRAVNAIMIPLEDIQKFQRGASGRERKVTPLWRISSGENTQLMTLILVQMRAGKQEALMQRLEQIRKDKQHLFPGTIARSIVGSQTNPGQAIISLIWRGTIIPEEAEREEALEAFRLALDDVLDWSSAEYNNGTAFMHT